MRSVRSLLQLLLCILLCEGAGIFGSIFTITKIPTWYEGLTRPGIAPPNWVFGPVWTTLYFLMGISLYIVLQERGRVQTGYAIGIFSVQLILNASWSYFFFGLESTFLGFVSILLVLAAVILTVSAFFRVSRRAALLLIPYLCWVSFATLVAYQLWMLNP